MEVVEHQRKTVKSPDYEVNHYKNGNMSFFPKRSPGPTLFSASALITDSQSYGSVAQRSSNYPSYGKYGRHHPKECNIDIDVCFLCRQIDNFLKEYLFVRHNDKGMTHSSTPSVSTGQVTLKGITLRISEGQNRLHFLTSSKNLYSSTGIVIGTLFNIHRI